MGWEGDMAGGGGGEREGASNGGGEGMEREERGQGP